MMKINLLAPRVPPLGAKRIPLTQGQAQFVSAEDYERHNQDKWQAVWCPTTKTFYAVRAVRRGGKRINLRAHREILGLEHGDPREVHHINGNTLDNRRENLKVVTPVEHADEHRNDPRKDVSKYGIGVYLEPRTGRFYALAQVAGKRHNIGTFDTVEEARNARDTFLQQHGERPLVVQGGFDSVREAVS